MHPAIVAQNISKRYAIGRLHSHTLVDHVSEGVSRVLKNLRILGRAAERLEESSFWALRDVSFTIARGEAVGVIGRNGAGKSTLLKLLSRITSPTLGRVRLRGRVGALLEVGTGFHPELSGRDNVFLNGALLGMSRSEIRRRYCDIVEFAEVQRFIETPVKHYSSGMYARLAFSVAAHLDSDILIVDEVLAVGDVSFQRRCLERMESIAEGGRTVLFVSHNMAAISALCQSGLLLEAGQLVSAGPVSEVLTSYLSAVSSQQSEWVGNEGDAACRMRHFWVRPTNAAGIWHTGSPIEVGLTVDVLEPVRGLVLGFQLKSQYDTDLAYILYDDNEATPPPVVASGQITKRFLIPADTLSEGAYRILPDVGIHMIRHCVSPSRYSLHFELQNVSGLGRRYAFGGGRGYRSLFRPNWSCESRITSEGSQEVDDQDFHV